MEGKTKVRGNPSGTVTALKAHLSLNVRKYRREYSVLPKNAGD